MCGRRCRVLADEFSLPGTVGLICCWLPAVGSVAAAASREAVGRGLSVAGRLLWESGCPPRRGTAGRGRPGRARVVSGGQRPQDPSSQDEQAQGSEASLEDAFPQKKAWKGLISFFLFKKHPSKKAKQPNNNQTDKQPFGITSFSMDQSKSTRI